MKINKVMTRSRKPEEVTSPRLAIRNFCLECLGYSASEVKLCTDPGCWLYPWRLGRTPAELKKKSTGICHLPIRKAG